MEVGPGIALFDTSLFNPGGSASLAWSGRESGWVRSDSLVRTLALDQCVAAEG